MLILVALLLTNWLIPQTNPVRLDSRGKAVIYLQKHKSYRIELYAEIDLAHPSGWMCNGIPVGRQIWSHDDVEDRAAVDDIPNTLPLTQSEFFDINGKSVNAGYVCTFKSGTRVPQYTLRLR